MTPPWGRPTSAPSSAGSTRKAVGGHREIRIEGRRETLLGLQGVRSRLQAGASDSPICQADRGHRGSGGGRKPGKGVVVRGERVSALRQRPLCRGMPGRGNRTTGGRDRDARQRAVHRLWSVRRYLSPPRRRDGRSSQQGGKVQHVRRQGGERADSSIRKKKSSGNVGHSPYYAVL